MAPVHDGVRRESILADLDTLTHKEVVAEDDDDNNNDDDDDDVDDDQSDTDELLPHLDTAGTVQSHEH